MAAMSHALDGSRCSTPLPVIADGWQEMNPSTTSTFSCDIA